jgi:hypothetical protein
MIEHHGGLVPARIRSPGTNVKSRAPLDRFQARLCTKTLKNIWHWVPRDVREREGWFGARALKSKLWK